MDGEGMEIGRVVRLLEGNDGRGGGVGSVDECVKDRRGEGMPPGDSAAGDTARRLKAEA